MSSIIKLFTYHLILGTHSYILRCLITLNLNSMRLSNELPTNYQKALKKLSSSMCIVQYSNKGIELINLQLLFNNNNVTSVNSFIYFPPPIVVWRLIKSDLHF